MLLLEHAIHVVRKLVSGGPTVFKIGLTSDPGKRWGGKTSYAYRRSSDLFQQMVVVIEVQSSEAAGFAEAALINVFRDTCGCRNDAAGGEGLPAKPILAPYYIYVVYIGIWKPHPQLCQLID